MAWLLEYCESLQASTTHSFLAMLMCWILLDSISASPPLKVRMILALLPQLSLLHCRGHQSWALPSSSSILHCQVPQSRSAQLAKYASSLRTLRLKIIFKKTGLGAEMDAVRVCVCVGFVLYITMRYLFIFALSLYVALSLSLFRCLSMSPSSRCPIFVLFVYCEQHGMYALLVRACEHTGFIFICLSHTRMHNYTCCRTSSHRILTIFNMRCCHRHLWPRYSTRSRAHTHTKDIPQALLLAPLAA